MNINVFSVFDNEGRARHPLMISVKHINELSIYFTGISTMPQSQANHNCFQILQNTLIKSIFVCDASVNFYLRKFSRDTTSFAV